ncbi:hypothetical protein GGU10DRAFT_287113 [Lentinula aff. detonsa]|uniref:Small ribosomal subunit protein uS10 domain-containing protein n=1 Tax=Lentinula aff. detonsa TaxID=2804958 RepID=A0AA38KGC1_9AGAR|nr:hypothetical protein GGU10DRAFT_287113 [Lentinula aff. detonsa]
MYRASTHGYKCLQQLASSIPRSNGFPRRARLPHNRLRVASIHGSAVELYPRKLAGNLENIEEGYDSASIQELIDKDDLDLDRLDAEDDFDPDLFLQKDSVTKPPVLAQSGEELFETGHFQQELPPISPLPSGLDPRQLPVKIKSLSDLGPNPTEEAYASALVHGRSIHLPHIHPRTQSIPAGNITFYSHHPRLLALFTHFASHAASSLAIPISKVIMLPTDRSLWTVIRAPFAYKKSQENFERKTHKRMIKAWDADPEVIDRWVRYLEKHSMGGVGIRVTKWERLPIGIGKTRLARVKEAFKAPVPDGVSSADAKLLEVQQEGDSDANRKQAIKALGEKILKEELRTFEGSRKPAPASTEAGTSGSQVNASPVMQQAKDIATAKTVPSPKSVPEKKSASASSSPQSRPSAESSVQTDAECKPDSPPSSGAKPDPRKQGKTDGI